MQHPNKALAIALSMLPLLALVAPAFATPQLGAGLHYLRTLGDIKEEPEVDENAFAGFGTLTVPLGVVRVEGNVEFVPDYLGSDHWLVQPAAYGLLDFGPAYAGAGIGIGYLDGEWATNPYYALRAGLLFDLRAVGGVTLDVFTSYRFQSATFEETTQNFDMDTLTFAAQLKFGGQ